jgi:hypothetical protein
MSNVRATKLRNMMNGDGHGEKIRSEGQEMVKAVKKAASMAVDDGGGFLVPLSQLFDAVDERHAPRP